MRGEYICINISSSFLLGTKEKFHGKIIIRQKSNRWNNNLMQSEKKKCYKKFKAWVSGSLGKMDLNEAFSIQGKNTKDVRWLYIISLCIQRHRLYIIDINISLIQQASIYPKILIYPWMAAGSLRSRKSPSSILPTRRSGLILMDYINSQLPLHINRQEVW